MKNLTALSLKIVHKAVLLFLCVVSAASAAMAGEGAYNPPPSYYYCTSDPAAHTRYYSEMFKVSWKDADGRKMSDSFQQFLSQKYGVKSTAACFGDPEQSKAQYRIKQQVEQLHISKWTLVQTKWTYNGAPSEGIAVEASSSNPASPGSSSASSKNAIEGVYTGTYVCAKGPTDLKLTLKAPEYGLLTGTFTFFVPPGTHNKAYTFSMNGHFDPASGKFNLNPLKWEGAEPPNYLMVGLTGAVDAKAGKVAGVVNYTGCGRFEAMKGRDD